MQVGSLNTTPIFQNEQTQALNTSRVNSTQESSQEQVGVQNLSLQNSYQNQFLSVGQNIASQNSTLGQYQLAESTLQGINAGAQRLDVISSQLSDGNLNATQQSDLTSEFNSITDSINTLVNGSNLFGQNSQLGLSNIDTSSLSANNNNSVRDFMDSLQENIVNAANGRENTIASLTSTLDSLTQNNNSQNQLQDLVNSANFNQNAYGQNVQSQQFAQAVYSLVR